MTGGACGAFEISASPTPTKLTLFTPSKYSNSSITGQFIADDSCKDPISDVKLVAGSKVSEKFYFKPTLQSGVSAGLVELKVTEQRGLQSSMKVTVNSTVPTQ
jgi:hypothetical protein